jgi:hypothetical protein
MGGTGRALIIQLENGTDAVFRQGVTRRFVGGLGGCGPVPHPIC